MAFKDVRRQNFLNEAHVQERRDDLIYRINDRLQELNDQSLRMPTKRSFSWTIACDRLELLVLHYTAGHPISELAKEFPAVIAAFDAFIPFDNPSPNEAYTLTITQHEAYVYVMWLLCLCQLLGHAEKIPTVLGWLDQHADFNRGRDGLFESVVQKLTGNHVETERVLLHPQAYRPLAKATAAQNSDDRPALVKEFLQGWYKNMKPCYWHGTHTDKEGSSYFGYWAFEAALVTYLWNIDDSSYRDHLVYPKDLVDFARQHFPYSGPAANTSERSNLRCPAGQPCPRSGFWFTPARVNSRQRFEQGQVMPEVGGDYGATIWQWDEQQTA